MNAETLTEQRPLAIAEDSVVEGEITLTVRVVRVAIAALVLAALVAGIVRGFTSARSGEDAVLAGMYLTQASLGLILVLLGSLVEGFGFGLSLGTHWPYTRNIVTLLLRGDPEAAHRLVATLVGLFAVALVVIAPSAATISGLALIIAAALLGIGTLHVLAGRFPSFVHGTHGLLAYGVLLSYLTLVFPHAESLGPYFGHTHALYPVLVTVFLGGMTTGQRGFGRAIGAFDFPHRASQWTVVVHLLAALSVVSMLGSLMPTYRVAFYLAVGQIVLGFLLFHAVNLRPKSPGILVAFHQLMALAITVAIVVVVV